MRLTSNQRNWLVFTVAAAATSGLAALFLLRSGTSDVNISATLRASAHASFLVLVAVFAARPLRQLLPTQFTLALLRNRRLVGVAFAGIHAAHLGLIVLRDRLSPDFEFVVVDNLPGAFIYLLILLMFVTSFDTPARALGARRWRVLHKTGLYLVFAAFLPTLIPDSRAQLLGARGVLLIVAALAIGIRVLAYWKRRRPASDADALAP